MTYIIHSECIISEFSNYSTLKFVCDINTIVLHQSYIWGLSVDVGFLFVIWS